MLKKCNVMPLIGKLVFMLLALAITYSCSNPVATIQKDEVNVASRSAFPEWVEWTPYETGALVSYKNVDYKCIQGHTSQPDWTPDIPVLALWAPVSGGSNGLPYIKPWNSNKSYVVGDWVDFNNSYYYAISKHDAQKGWFPTAAPSLWSRLPSEDVQPDEIEVLANPAFVLQAGGWPSDGITGNFTARAFQQSGLYTTYGLLSGLMSQDITSKLKANSNYQLNIAIRTVEDMNFRVKVEKKSGSSYTNLLTTDWITIGGKGPVKWFTGADGMMHKHVLGQLERVTRNFKAPADVSGDLRFVIETDTNKNSADMTIYGLSFQKLDSAFIKADGNKLVRGSKEFTFDGIAFTNYYYMDDLAADINYGDDSVDTDSFLNVRHHRQDDFYRLKNMGFNTIRFALNGDWFLKNPSPTTDPEDLWKWIDQSITMAYNADLFTVLEMHQPIGDAWLNEADLKNLTSDRWIWNSKDKQEKFVNVWKEIAKKYKNDPRVAAYGLLNEPKTTDKTGETWFGTNNGNNDDGLLDILIKEIRKIDDNHLLLIDSYSGDLIEKDSSKLVWSTPYTDDNLMFDMHFYYDGTYSHKGALWGGGSDNGSWYPDEYKIFNELYKSKAEPLYGDSVTSSDQEYTPGQWKTYYTEPLVNYNQNTNEAKFGMMTPVFNVNPSYDTEVVDGKKNYIGKTITAEILFDNFILEERKIGSSNWEAIRECKVVGKWKKDKSGTNDGWMCWDWMGDANAAEYLVKNEGSDSGNKSYGVKNVKNGPNEHQAVDWAQSWLMQLKPKKGYEYRAKVDVKISEDMGDTCLYFGPKINVFKGAYLDGNTLKSVNDGTIPDSWYGFDKDFLKEKMFVLKTKADNNVPVSVFEFGLMEVCFKDTTDIYNNPEINKSYGGYRWMGDLKSLLYYNNVSWATWAFRNKDMGMFKHIFTHPDDKTGTNITNEYIKWNEESQKNVNIFNAIDRFVD